MRQRLLPLAVPLLVASLALGACGTDDPPVANAPVVEGEHGENPCELLTADQAKQALKVDQVEPGKPIGDVCVYTVTAKPDVSLGAGHNHQAKTAADLDRLVKQGREQGAKVEELSGIGDAAYLLEANRTLHLLVGDTPYLVTGPADREILTAAAKFVAENAP